MLTTEVVTLIYNHIQHGIYIIISFSPNVDRPSEDQPSNQVGFTLQDHINIQSILYIKGDCWYQLWVT